MTCWLPRWGRSRAPPAARSWPCRHQAFKFSKKGAKKEACCQHLGAPVLPPTCWLWGPEQMAYPVPTRSGRNTNAFESRVCEHVCRPTAGPHGARMWRKRSHCTLGGPMRSHKCVWLGGVHLTQLNNPPLPGGP